MRKLIFRVATVLVFAAIAYMFYQAGASEKNTPSALTIGKAPTVTTVAFGSCNRQDRPQDYWATIGGHQPTAWLWLGDNIYADTRDMAQMEADYEQQKSAPAYAAFVAATPHVYGGWDDHDYGSNDAGREWEMKDEAKERLLDFLDVPAAADVRRRPGTYQAYTLGEGERTVRVLILDTRYFRDPVAPATRQGDRYGQNPEGDILGEAQWTWLEEELRGSTAAAHLILSSIQVLPTDHPYEKWSLFPTARQRLLDLLAAVRPALPLLLSGDRHLGEITLDTSTGYPIYEVTSSGLTHAYENAQEANGRRISDLVDRENFGLVHYFWSEEDDKPRLLAQIRTIADDGVAAQLALNHDGSPADPDPLRKLVETNDPMSIRLRPCPGSPNCISTQSTRPSEAREPIAFEGSAAAAKEKLMERIAAMPRTRLLRDEGNYLHYTFKTWPVPFIDDVEFVIDPEEKVIHYRSASRVGHSDLGANRRRMDKVVAAFRQ